MTNDKPNHPDNAFDQALADTASDLEEIAQETLKSDEVKEALADEDRDDTW